MTKKLSEMTLEELWRLFPVKLTEHKECWKEQYAEEETRLRAVLGEDAEIFHIGSTAVEGIWAKPIVDILIEVGAQTDLKQTAAKIEKAGYITMSESDKRISLNKGYTETGFAEKVFHVHLQNASEKDEVYFRDYLNAHPSIAKEYESLKLSLRKKYAYNRDAYTAAKSAFVKKYTDIAKGK